MTELLKLMNKLSEFTLNQKSPKSIVITLIYIITVYNINRNCQLRTSKLL